jgi:hypothetical protein
MNQKEKDEEEVKLKFKKLKADANKKIGICVPGPDDLDWNSRIVSTDIGAESIVYVLKFLSEQIQRDMMSFLESDSVYQVHFIMKKMEFSGGETREDFEASAELAEKEIKKNFRVIADEFNAKYPDDDE